MKRALCGLLLVSAHANAMREIISMTLAELQQLRWYREKLEEKFPMGFYIGEFESSISDQPEQPDNSNNTPLLEACLICIEKIDDLPRRVEVDHMQLEKDRQAIKQKKSAQKLEARESMRRMWQQQQRNRSFNTTYHAGKN